MIPTSNSRLQQAITHHTDGDYTACESLCLELLCDDPTNGDAFHLIGLANYARGDFQLATDSINQAISLSPNNALYHANLATVLNDANDTHGALHHYQTAIRLDANNAPSYNGLGIIARKHLNHSLAAEHYRRAIEIDSKFSAAHNNLANVLTLIGQPQSALEHAKKALEIAPEYAEAWNNLGFAKTMLADFSGAKTAFERAITIRPDLAIAHFNLGANLLRQGDYRAGWRKYEWRLRLNGQNPHIDPDKFPLPSLKDMQRRHVVLMAEQGMGDFIQFLRFAKFLYEAGVNITITCDNRLIRLLSTLPWFQDVIPRNSPLPECDYTVPMMSLGKLLAITSDNIPTPIPYIACPIAQAEKWRQRLSKDNQLIVGFTWFGNPENPVNQLRSPPLPELHVLANIPGIRLVSLQTGAVVAELEMHRDRFNPIDIGAFEAQKDLSFDFIDTAAILLNVDIFITSCTVTAHLAGALGVPTWVVLSHVADWRWGLDDEISRWYPKTRIFRQPTAGDWGGAFRQVKQALMATVNSTS